MKLIEKVVSMEALTEGATLEVQAEGRTYKVKVPEGAVYGTKLRLGKGQDALLVKLVPPEGEAIAAMGDVAHVLAAEHITAELVRLLIESTRDRRELGGSCRVRPPATHELKGLDSDAEHVWVIDGIVLTTRGTREAVHVRPLAGSTLDFHTHPGVYGGSAGFSQQDKESVIESGRPMMVIGYSVLGPDLVTVAALPLGGLGVALGLGLKAALHVEAARRDIPARLLKLGVAARVCFPDGRTLPVRLAGGNAVRRTVESVAFELDRVAAAVSEKVGEARERVMTEMMRRMTK